MKTSFLCFFLLKILAAQAVIPNEKVFVGYINDKPVFNSFSEKKLYVLNEKLESLNVLSGRVYGTDCEKRLHRIYF